MLAKKISKESDDDDDDEKKSIKILLEICSGILCEINASVDHFPSSQAVCNVISRNVS